MQMELGPLFANQLPIQWHELAGDPDPNGSIRRIDDRSSLIASMYVYSIHPDRLCIFRRTPSPAPLY